MSCCSCWIVAATGGIVGFLALVKLYCKLTTPMYKGKERLDGKTVVITGANAGIGYETTKDLAKRGARIIMVCRNVEKAKAVRESILMDTGNTKIIIKHIDFASFESVRKCAKEIAAEEKRIDILINNAGETGFGVCLTDDGFEKVMQTNHYGPFLFTNILLDNIIKSAPSKIVNVSSDAYKMAKIDFELLKNFQPANYKDTAYSQFKLYASSKLANIFFTNILAEKLKNKGVTVNSLHPGAVKTDIFRYAENWMKVFFYFICSICFKTAKEGAQTTIYVAISPDVAKVTGGYFADCKQQTLQKHALDEGVAKKLWEVSEQAVKLQKEEIFY